MSTRLETLPDAQGVAQALAGLLAERLRQGGRAVLAGGQTPLPAYRLLGRRSLPWKAIELIPSDERCLEPESPERNDRQIGLALGQPEVRLHRFPAERGPALAAAQMEGVVTALLPFAVVVLGLGSDGHAASLFPGASSGVEALVAPVYRAPKPPPQRVTLTPKALAQTSLLVFVVTGAEKREALERVLRGEPLPPNHIAAPQRLFLCDRAALPSLG